MQILSGFEYGTPKLRIQHLNKKAPTPEILAMV